MSWGVGVILRGAKASFRGRSTMYPTRRSHGGGNIGAESRFVEVNNTV